MGRHVAPLLGHRRVSMLIGLLAAALTLTLAVYVAVVAALERPVGQTPVNSGAPLPTVPTGTGHLDGAGGLAAPPRSASVSRSGRVTPTPEPVPALTTVPDRPVNASPEPPEHPQAPPTREPSPTSPAPTPRPTPEPDSPSPEPAPTSPKPPNPDSGLPVVSLSSIELNQDRFLTWVTVGNRTTEPVAWVLEFGYDEILLETSWQAHVQVSGSTLTARGEGDLAPGEWLRFGYIARGEPSSPHSCTLNGSACVSE